MQLTVLPCPEAQLVAKRELPQYNSMNLMLMQNFVIFYNYPHDSNNMGKFPVLASLAKLAIRLLTQHKCMLKNSQTLLKTNNFLLHSQMR